MAPQSAAPTHIPRATFASMVGERIRARILDGSLAPGSQLNEMELAGSFGVSRGPVREALQRLIQEGLLRSEPHRGVFVPVMTDADLADIYFIRGALESAALERIMGSRDSAATHNDLDRLVKRMEKASAAHDWNTVAALDLEFHTVLVARAASPRLTRMFTTVISETRLCLTMLLGGYDARHDLVREHREICDLIRRRDTANGVAALKAHFHEAIDMLKDRAPVEHGNRST